MMKTIEETMNTLGGFSRSAYRPNEVETLLSLRDDEHEKEKNELLLIIAILTAVCGFLVFAVSMLW